MASMRRLVAVVVVFASARAAPVRADDGTHAQAVALAEQAHAAALAGQCKAARSLADEVQQLDEAYYQVSIVVDPAITNCVQAAAPPTVVRPGQEMPAGRPAAEMPAPRPLVPPLGGRLFGEVALGYLASIGGLFVGGVVSAAFVDEGCGDVCIPTPVLIGAYVGGTLALSVGVYTAGSIGNQRGSFGSTIAGGLLGGTAALLVAIAIASDNEVREFGGFVMGTSLIVAPMVGAMIGFNRTRAWDSPVGSLVHVQRGRLGLGVPLVVRGESQGRAMTIVPVVSGGF